MYWYPLLQKGHYMTIQQRLKYVVICDFCGDEKHLGKRRKGWSRSSKNQTDCCPKDSCRKKSKELLSV